MRNFNLNRMHQDCCLCFFGSESVGQAPPTPSLFRKRQFFAMLCVKIFYVQEGAAIFLNCVGVARGGLERLGTGHNSKAGGQQDRL